MANVIIPNKERQDTTKRIMEQFGADRRDSVMRDAAETLAVRQQEAIDKATKDRRYFVCR